MEKLPTSDESLKSKQVRQSVHDQDVLLDSDTMREGEIGAKVNLDSRDSLSRRDITLQE